jgi:hypothetical protein
VSFEISPLSNYNINIYLLLLISQMSCDDVSEVQLELLKQFFKDILKLSKRCYNNSFCRDHELDEYN